MTDQIKSIVLTATKAREIIKVDTIQQLWSGYGQLLRCTLDGGIADTVVVKHVKLPTDSIHPRGWNTNRSHQRKLKSYHVEMAWYANLARKCDRQCRVPKIYHAEEQSEEMLMIMEDLNGVGFPDRRVDATLDEIKSCLRWLAHFHAKFMDVKTDDLWDVGTYWHLDTRPDELESMLDQDLKAVANDIDKKLNSAKYQTLVHGDAKLANFCFSPDGTKVAAVDFQYVGHGCGMKDVAYLLSSCLLHEEDLNNCESELLDFYFKCLDHALTEYQLCSDFVHIQKEWRALYPYAWADFYRFLDGWSPGHWKMNDYSRTMKEKVLRDSW